MILNTKKHGKVLNHKLYLYDHNSFKIFIYTLGEIMPAPAILAAAAPYLLSALPTLAQFGGSALGSYFGQPSQPQQPNQASPGAIPGTGGEGNWLTGYGAQTQQLPRFTPEQQSALNQLLQQGLGNADFGGIEKRELNRFNTETIPGLAERFTALGGGGSQRSSAFQGALGSAGAQLGERLGALRSQHGLQQLGLGLTPSFENIYIPGREGAAGPIAQAGGQAATQMFPLFLQWLQQYMAQQNPQQIRAQNIQQGYQPLGRPTPIRQPAPMQPIPQLGGI